jgi:hypothetical protein
VAPAGIAPRIPTLAFVLLLGGPAAGAECDRASITILTGEGKAHFAVEIADEPAEQARGLMFRPALPEGAGMLFLYDPPQQARFWMRNTMIPLDMVFIDDAGRVESVAERRDTYSERVSGSGGPVRAVLEINGGLAARLGIGPGDQAVHPAFRAAPEGARCDP